MWSGPQTISSAMMRSWEARGDTAVIDEPLYAHYLEVTGAPHPGADEVIATHETDWRRVVELLTGPVPEGRSIFYQKHMAHHLLPAIERGWLAELVNCFLIRDPRRMLASLARVTPEPALCDTGLPQQVEIFDLVRDREGSVPPVVDSADVLRDPPGVLARLCERIGIPYTDRMLSWPPGIRPTDGIWAKHWYDSVEQSTGFEPYSSKEKPFPDRLLPLLSQCEPLYARLHEHRIT
jgi:hypothetical protein